MTIPDAKSARSSKQRFQNVAVRFQKITGWGGNVARCCGFLDPPRTLGLITPGMVNFLPSIATILQNDITGYGFLVLGWGSRAILKGDAGAEWNALRYQTGLDCMGMQDGARFWLD
jgi:hypothetical protein